MSSSAESLPALTVWGPEPDLGEWARTETAPPTPVGVHLLHVHREELARDRLPSAFSM